MFKKKTWKRGDKLNAKELNRIEEGIVTAQGSGANNALNVLYITADEDITDMAQGADHITFSNWSISPEELDLALYANKKICLQLNVFQTLPQSENLEQVGVYYIDSFYLRDGAASFVTYINDVGWFSWELNVPKESNEIQFIPTYIDN